MNPAKKLLGVAACVLTGAMALGHAKPAHGCQGDGNQTIGSICMVAYTYCPRGYGEASGGLIAINDNTALFSLIGNTYGGDGRSTFAVPDLRGRIPIGVGNGPGLQPIILGEQRGDEDRVLGITQMPLHGHTATATFTPDGGGGGGTQVKVEASTELATEDVPADGSYIAVPRPNTFGTATVGFVPTGSQGTTVELGGVSGGGGSSGGGTVSVQIVPNGGATPVETFDPSLGIRFCIALEGIYPSRN